MSGSHSSHEDGMFVRFARDYGWRAYAIPVMVVITIWVLFDVLTTPDPAPAPAGHSHANTHAQHTESETADGGPNPADVSAVMLAEAELPPGGAYTESGDGTYRVVGKPGAKAGQAEHVIRYVVQVENGVDTTNYGGDDAFAAMVDATLTNPKGWTADPKFAFEHIEDPEKAELHIQLSSVNTTHELCGYNIKMETSCFYTIGNRVIINESRWVRGALPFQGDLGSYRQYLLNHEVGHGIGYAAHEPCRANGELAPVMMQQTLSLSNAELYKLDPNEVYPNEDTVCMPNPWPYPRGFSQ